METTLHRTQSASAVIDALGGTSAVAKLCDINSQAVSQWRTKGIPQARRKFLELLRPDLFAHESIIGAPAAQRKTIETAVAAE